MKRKHTHRCDLSSASMIRHVRRQIKSLISGLMSDLANYQRYLKTL